MIIYNNCSFLGRVFQFPAEMDSFDCFSEILDMFNEHKDSNGEIRLSFSNDDLKKKGYRTCISEIKWEHGNEFTLKRLGEFLYAVYDGDEPLMIEDACDAMLYSIWLKLKEMK